MFEKQQFIKPVYNLKELPREKLPVIILCGRSNVGKSSLINSLFNRKDLAKTSSSPGKTRSINYYKIDDKFFIADLPGYGYAKTGKKERDYWGKLISKYVSTEKGIVLAVHLIDSRVSPTELDIQLNYLLNELRIPFLVLLSKIDKLNRSAQKASIDEVKEKIPGLSLNDNLLIYSATNGTGRKEFLKKLSSLFYKH
jgi:GTP-binding protein